MAKGECTGNAPGWKRHQPAHTPAEAWGGRMRASQRPPDRGTGVGMGLASPEKRLTMWLRMLGRRAAQAPSTDADLRCDPAVPASRCSSFSVMPSMSWDPLPRGAPRSRAVPGTTRAVAAVAIVSLLDTAGICCGGAGRGGGGEAAASGGGGGGSADPVATCTMSTSLATPAVAPDVRTRPEVVAGGQRTSAVATPPPGLLTTVTRRCVCRATSTSTSIMRPRSCSRAASRSGAAPEASPPAAMGGTKVAASAAADPGHAPCCALCTDSDARLARLARRCPVAVDCAAGDGHGPSDRPCSTTVAWSTPVGRLRSASASSEATVSALAICEVRRDEGYVT